MTTYKDWDGTTNGYEVANAFAQQIPGKNVVITGVGPKSLGESLAKSIAKHSPANLILASRTKSKIEAVVKDIQESSPKMRPAIVELDLSSQKSVRAAAKEVAKLVDRIDILINNAGVCTSELCYTTEGIELQFGTNHVGPFLFTNLLLPQIKAAAAASSDGSTRVIMVSSQGHRLSPVRFHDYNFKGEEVPADEVPPSTVPEKFLPKPGNVYSPFIAYGQSKTANILFALSLSKRLEKEGIRSYAVHPGSIRTDMSRNLTQEDADVIESTGGTWVELDQGTGTILVAALDPALSGCASSVFLSDCRLAEAVPHATDSGLAQKLWELSERLTSE